MRQKAGRAGSGFSPGKVSSPAGRDSARVIFTLGSDNLERSSQGVAKAGKAATNGIAKNKETDFGTFQDGSAIGASLQVGLTGLWWRSQLTPMKGEKSIARIVVLMLHSFLSGTNAAVRHPSI